MKQHSIEEKAKAYDEAKSIMEEYLKSGNAGVIAENTIKKAFPELEVDPIFRVGDYIRNTKTGDKVLIEQLDMTTKAYCYMGYDGAAVNHSDFPFSQQDKWQLIGHYSKMSTTVEKDMTEYKKGFECGKQLVLKYPEDFGLCKKSDWLENQSKAPMAEPKESEEEKTKRMLDVISYKMSQHQPDIFTEEENEWFYYWLKDKLKINYV